MTGNCQVGMPRSPYSDDWNQISQGEWNDEFPAIHMCGVVFAVRGVVSSRTAWRSDCFEFNRGAFFQLHFSRPLCFFAVGNDLAQSIDGLLPE